MSEHFISFNSCDPYNTLLGRYYYYFYFTDKETITQKSVRTCQDE